MAANRIRQMGNLLNRWLRFDPQKTSTRPRPKSNRLRGIETIEHRRMLAGTELVFDVNVVPDSIRYEEGIELDGAFYFWATSTEHSRTNGSYLWKYDPNANGGRGEAEPLSLDVVNTTEYGEQNMIVFDGKIYFGDRGGLSFYDPANDSFTYAADVNVTGTSTYPTRYEVLNDKLYILGFDDSFDRILIEYDPQAGGGTGAATTVGEFGSGGFQWMKALGNRLYFSYEDRDLGIGEELRYYDPAASNGQGAMGVIVDFNVGVDYGPLDDAIVWDEKLYFVADDGIHRELRQYDPAANNGQGELSTISDFESIDRADPKGSYAVLEGKLYFTAYTYATGTELWRYDPADGSVDIVEDFYPSLSSSSPQFLTVVAGKLYYYGSYDINKNGLIRFDPTANAGEGKIEVVNVPEGFSALRSRLASFDDKLVGYQTVEYEKSPLITGPALYDPEANDGAGETTFLPYILEDTQSTNPSHLIEVNGKYYFRGHETAHYAHLWEYDPAAPAGVDPVRRVTGDVVADVEDELYLFNEKIYFAGYTVEHGVELWEYDPAANNGDGQLRLVGEIEPGFSWSRPEQFTAVGGKLYFTAYADQGEELFVYDPDANGGEGEVRLAADIHPNGSSSPSNLAEYNGKLYMSAWDGESGVEVWVYDPAARGGIGGATLLADLVPGWYSSSPKGFTEFNGKLYFAAEDDDEAFELWEYNPAATGGIEPLRRLVNLKDGRWNPPQPGMVPFDGKLYFCAYNEAFGNELWVYDPATDAVSMVADVAPGELDFSPIKKIAFDGKLYMIGSGPSGDNQLWAYDPAAFDGLSSLTKVDLNYNEGSLSDLVDLWLFDGKIYLDAFDINYGHELFVYDPSQIPSAVDDTYTLQEDTPLTIDAAAGILSNDSNVGDGPLIVRVTTNASHGTLVVNDDGSFTYTADANYHGIDSFVYEVEDRHGEVTSGTVQLTIESVDDAAVISGDTSGTTDEDSTTIVTGTLTVFDTDPGESSFIAQINTVGTYGTFWMNSVGNWDYTVDTSLTQSLSGLDVALDTFTVQSFDGAQQDVTIQINGLNDVPTFGSTPMGSVEEDGTLVVSGTAAVTDPDAGESSFQVYSSTTPYGTYTLDASGNWTYTLDNAKAQKLLGGETITDWVVMVPLDGSTSLNFPITITGQHDVAVIGGQLTGSVQEDITLGASGKATITDPDQGQAAFITQSGTSGTYGTFSIDASGDWTYDLDNGAAQSLKKNETVTEYFEIESVDGSDSRVIGITAQGTNDSAVISGDTFGQTDEDTTADLLGTLTITDTDTNENFFAAQLDTVGIAGMFSVDALGNWTYQLDGAAVQSLPLGQMLQDSFTVVSLDGTEQLVTIDIHGLNDLPVPTIVSVAGYSFVGNPISVAGMVEDIDTVTGAIVFEYSVYHEDNVNPLIISSEDLNHFSFTPQLTGEYRIVLSVMDDQGGSATTEQTIAIGEASNVNLQLVHGSTAQAGDINDGPAGPDQMLHEWQDATGQLWLTIEDDLPPGPLNMSFELLYTGELHLAPQVVDQMGIASIESEVVDQGIRSTLTLMGVDFAEYEVGDRVLLAKIAYPKDVANAAGLPMDQQGGYPQPLSEHGVQLVSADLAEAGQVLRAHSQVPGQIAPVVFDADDDGRVGLDDFAGFIANYGRQPGTDEPNAFRFDYNQDGRVGLSDFAEFVRHYGKRKSQAAVSIDIPTAMANPAAASTFTIEEEPATTASSPTTHEFIVQQWIDNQRDPAAGEDDRQDTVAAVMLEEAPLPIEFYELDARVLDATLGEMNLNEDSFRETDSTDEDLLPDWMLSS